MTLSTPNPPTFADNYLTTILSPDALAVLSEFRKGMKEAKKVSKVTSIAHLLAPTS